MVAQSDFASYCCELLASSHPALRTCKARRMFGGWGISADGLNFAIISRDQLYLKADAQSAPIWQQAQCPPFEYEARGKRHQLSYYTPPPEALESSSLMTAWSTLAFEAALRAANSKRRPARASKPAAKPTSRSSKRQA
jgi:DNA transformation protein